MKCYDHNEIDAVSTCLGCGKALCKSCTQSSKLGIIVCSEACGKRADSRIEMVELIRKKTLTQNKIGGIFLIIFGIVFGVFGIYNLTDSRLLPLSIFLMTISAGFMYGGFMYLKVAKTKQ